MSALLDRLNQELVMTTDVNKRATILVKMGSYYARIGSFESARKIIAELRLSYGDGHNAYVSARLWLTEGLLYLFENLGTEALDRVNRSQFIALRTRDEESIAISSAWKAHIEFETSHFEAMVDSLKIALKHAKETDHDAHCRLSMVLSDAFLICGDRRSAQEWFLRSRDHALLDGDQASIEALLYNRAAFSLAWVRARRCLGEVDPSLVSHVRSEVSSATNLQLLTGVKALTNFIYLCNARLLILEEKFEQAIAALGDVRATHPFAAYNFNQSFVDLEIAFCWLRMNKLNESTAIFNGIDFSFLSNLDVDEQLVGSWLRHEMCAMDPIFGNIDEAKLRLNSLIEEYERGTVQLRELLDPFRLKH